jgi:hypothetical protein
VRLAAGGAAEAALIESDAGCDMLGQVTGWAGIATTLACTAFYALQALRQAPPAFSIRDGEGGGAIGMAGMLLVGAFLAVQAAGRLKRIREAIDVAKLELTIASQQVTHWQKRLKQAVREARRVHVAAVSRRVAQGQATLSGAADESLGSSGPTSTPPSTDAAEAHTVESIDTQAERMMLQQVVARTRAKFDHSEARLEARRQTLSDVQNRHSSLWRVTTLVLADGVLLSLYGALSAFVVGLLRVPTFLALSVSAIVHGITMGGVLLATAAVSQSYEDQPRPSRPDLV